MMKEVFTINYQNLLMNKSGIATQKIAEFLMNYNVNDQIPSVSEFCEQVGCSRGNVQIAIQNLKATKAISIRSRGHLGTFLEEVDYLRLAEICGNTNLVGVMPLPYSKKYEGLATALYTSCNSEELAVHIAFMRGSENRYQNLLDGRYNFCVMSYFAFLQYQKENDFLYCVENLGNQTYVTAHALCSKKPITKNWKGKRVGIDFSSVDQQTLTKRYFSNEKVEFIPLSYNQMISGIENETIDVCIWNIDDLQNRTDLFVKPVEIEEDGSTDTCAVMVTRKNDPVSTRLLKQVINIDEIHKIQHQVEAGTILPKY